MDADWSVEIGEDLPSIDVPWEGWVDLRNPSTARALLHTLPEAAAYPELAELLLEINRSNPANNPVVLTSKCDVFAVDGESASFGLMDADASAWNGKQAPLLGLGSYIDLCLTTPSLFSDFAWHEALVRRIASGLLAPLPAPRTSVELVLRQASLFTRPGFGLTLYATGYEREPAKAREAWAGALAVSASVTIKEIRSQVSAHARQQAAGT